MSDIYSKQKRSQIMGLISGKETRPEIRVRRFLFSKGLRYRKNVSSLPGKPDVVLPKYKTIVFVNGCFWHGHKHCRYAKIPSTNSAFWREKIEMNIHRDKSTLRKLKKMKWRVFVVWQCQLKSTNDLRLIGLCRQIITHRK
jgi:DNA mismatch endonuclease, patch repair protein